MFALLKCFKYLNLKSLFKNLFTYEMVFSVVSTCSYNKFDRITNMLFVIRIKLAYFIYNHGKVDIFDKVPNECMSTKH